jgi:glycosyltransferase involved in cell wall biosynthesis
MDIIKYFSDKNFFVRVIKKEDTVIIWNDYDILIKLKLEDILKYKIKLLDECCAKIMNEIEIKYKKNNRKISVIIPNYNNEKHIEKTILSILNNTYTNLEVIVVDDCSTDKSMTILLEKYGNNERVKIYSTQINSGTYYCRNMGILMSTGYYIGFVDGDDYILPGKYDYEIKNFDKLNQYWGYGTGFNRIYYEDNIDNIIEVKKSNYYNYIFYRKLFNMIGYYHDNRFGADSEFIKRLGMNGYKIYQDKNAIFYNAYSTAGKNLTQIYNSDVRKEYIRQCVETIKNKKYIFMALLDNKNFIRDIKYYKNNQLKYLKNIDNSTQTDDILFEELYNKIISKIESEYILQKKGEQELDPDQE